MADDPPKVRRTLQFRCTVPGADAEHIVARLRAAKPF
jgi:hypothetical protein